MDQLTFRRQALANPKCDEPEFLAYVRANPEEAKWLSQLQSFDDEIQQAAQVPVPEGLADRIILNQSMQTRRSHQRWWQAASGIAASVVIAISVVMWAPGQLSTDDVQTQVMAHIYDELDHLHMHKAVTDDQLAAKLLQVDLKMNQPLANLQYAGLCKIGQKPGAHLVVTGEKGPVTLLMMPKVQLVSQQVIEDQRFEGSVLPVGDGAIAVVGEKGEDLEKYRHWVTSQVQWL